MSVIETQKSLLALGRGLYLFATVAVVVLLWCGLGATAEAAGTQPTLIPQSVTRSPPSRQIPIGPERWVTTSPDEVSANVYLGRRSQHFNSVEHISRLRGLHLKNGKIEFDLASRNPRNPPWIHMGIGSKSPAKLSLHPRPQTALPRGPSLYRLVLTRNEMTSVVAMYRQPRAEFDPGSWVHVSIECRSNQCRVFLNHNETPLFSTGRLFEQGGFGVQGEGYIANLRLTTE